MILVIAEHRRGKIRNVTLEMIEKGRSLAASTKSQLVVVVLGKNIQDDVNELAYHADTVLAVVDDRLENFNASHYQKVLARVILDKKPLLTLIGHTSFGVDLASSLAAEIDYPLVMNCTQLEIVDNRPIATRQIYNGKLNCTVSFRDNFGIATVRPGVFENHEKKESQGEVIEVPSGWGNIAETKKFIKYYERPAGDVDITKSEYIVSAGRGVKKQQDLELLENLANAFGGVVACSRPIADKGWLEHPRQVGTSGKSVSAKLYIAAGISGAYQHTDGMRSCDTIIAINEDPYAPIMSVAHYAIVDDLYKVLPVLTDKISSYKASK